MKRNKTPKIIAFTAFVISIVFALLGLHSKYTGFVKIKIVNENEMLAGTQDLRTKTNNS